MYGSISAQCTQGAIRREDAGRRDRHNMLRQSNRVHNKNRMRRRRVGEVELGKAQWSQWALHVDYLSLQPMQKQKHKFRYKVATATKLLHHKEEGSLMSYKILPETVNNKNDRMEEGGG